MTCSMSEFVCVSTTERGFVKESYYINASKYSNFRNKLNNNVFNCFKINVNA